MTTTSEMLFDAVQSSLLSHVGFKDNTIFVRFKDSGKVFSYFGFSEADYWALKNAPSVGRMYNLHVKGVVRGTRREDLEETE